MRVETCGPSNPPPSDLRDAIGLVFEAIVGVWAGWQFTTRKCRDLQSADVFGICMFVAKASRWISAVTKRRLLGCGLNSFPCKACSKITFA